MFNKSFFLGVLTTLLVVIILAMGGLFALHFVGPSANARFTDGGRSGRFEQHFDRQGQPGDFGDQGQFGQKPDRFGDGEGHEFLDRRGGREGRISFSLLRGIGGVLGSLLLIGVIIAAVIGGQKLFKRFSGRSTPPPAAPFSAPVAPEEPPDTPSPEAPLSDTGEPAADAIDLETPAPDSETSAGEQNETQ